MCGRFTRFTPVADIAETFSAIASPVQLAQSYNVAPTQAIYVLQGIESRTVLEMRWGLVPSWSADISRASSMINARVESVHEKPSFRNLLARNRCVIPVNGYFEWKSETVNGKSSSKQPYYFRPLNGSQYCHDGMLAIAGLWTSWGSGSDTYVSCTALTTQASEQISAIHHRMPVLLDEQGIDVWLSEDAAVPIDEFAAVKDLRLDIHSGSKRVNGARIDDSSLIDSEAIEEADPRTLF